MDSAESNLPEVVVLKTGLNLHPTRTIRILRGQRGEKSEDVRALVLEAVAVAPELEFRFDGKVRRVAFVRLM